MRFAIISDIHVGEESEHKGVVRKMSRYSGMFLNDFINEMNNKVRPGFVVNLGDAINDIEHDIDISNLKSVLTTLKKLDCPVYNLAGNHEQRKIKKEELEKLLGYKPLYYSFDFQKYHFIVLFSDDYEKITPTIPQDEKEWLKQDLDKTSKPSIIFIHHSLADQDLMGNFWFEGRPNRSLVFNRGEIRSMLENSQKVIAVFNGHLHWNKMDVHNKIPYFNIQSLVENFRNEDVPSGCYAIIDLNEESIKVEIKGEDKQDYRYEFNRPGL